MKQSDLGGGDGLWYTTVKLDPILRRSYDHFAHLFGVRVYEDEQCIEANGYPEGMAPKQLYAERGMPHDIADTTRREHDEWGADAHSETWAYHHEVESALKGTELSKASGWKEALDISYGLSELFGNDEYVEGTIRWVVWFDN